MRACKKKEKTLLGSPASGFTMSLLKNLSF
jgi:hypothetical protein